MPEYALQRCGSGALCLQMRARRGSWKTGAGGAKNLLLKPIKLGGNAIGVQPSCGGHTIHDLVGDAHHGVQVANIVADPTPK